MYTFFIVLFSVSTVAYAGIYSAKWSANGDIPAKLSLRSGLGMHWIDSSSQYLSSPEPSAIQSQHSKLQNFEGNNIYSTVSPLGKSEIQNTNVEILEIPVSSAIQTQRNRRQDIDSSKYISIGSIYNELPKTKLEEASQYKPKRIRSISIVQETDTNAYDRYFEAPETPVSTIRTPNQAYYSNNPNNNYLSTNLGYPIFPLYNNYGPGGLPGHLDHHQSTSSSVNQIPVQRDPIDVPSYQSATAIAQNLPGFEFATASANSNGITNKAGASSFAGAFAQNYGGVQIASSWANLVSQSQAVSASQTDGSQSTNAQPSNQNLNGSDNSEASSDNSSNLEPASAMMEVAITE